MKTSKWTPTINKCPVCSKPPTDCSHNNTDIVKHKEKMQKRQSEDKRIEALVRKIVDQILTERGL